MSAFREQWHERANAGHAAEVAEGLHDDACEWRSNGHFLCNCAMRRRIASGYTEPPGELEHQYPLCPRCHDEVDHDGDSFYCLPCSVHWPDAHGPAEFTDDLGDLSKGVAAFEARAAAPGGET